MKTSKISKILGIGLAIAMLTSLLGVAIPAAAGTLSLSAELGPSTTTFVVKTSSDISDMAVSGSTIYAVSNTNNSTYKSIDGGGTWTALTVSTNASIFSQPQHVAVAPGDPNTVVVSGQNNVPSTVIFLSNDGGATFSNVPLAVDPLNVINAITISPLVAGVRNVTVAGTRTSDGTSDIQYFNLGAVLSTWTSLRTGTGWAGFPMTGTVNVQSIAYSPNFASDKVLVAVTNEAADSLFEIASFSSMKWNVAAGFAGYPKLLGGVAATADIALAPTYLGADETQRTAFVALNVGANVGSLIRLANTTSTNLTANIDFSSVDYNGTNLVAGAAADNNVYASANPTATTPTMTNTSLYQRPSGATTTTATKTLVNFSGATVVAGTSGTTSAFSISKDNGATFNDVSLIDVALTNLKDMAISANASTEYVISNNGVTTSVWRKTAIWERVLALPGFSSYIVRIAPEDAASVYVADTASTNMYYSNDSGEKSWQLRSLIMSPIDVAVESAQVAYALGSDFKVSKSSNAGFTWDSSIATGLTGGATIVSVKKDQLIVGGSDGKIAWSTNGNASATTWLTASPFTSGNVQVTADKLDTGGFVYAATSTLNQAIKRFTAGGTIATTISGNLTGAATGIALSNGVLYVITDENAAGTTNVSAVNRTLTPSTAVSTTVWDRVAMVSSTGTILNRTPQSLKVSTGKLWAVSVGGTAGVYSFTDSIYKTGPAPSSPADAASPQTNPVSGLSSDMAFSWPLMTSVTSYKLQISLDSAFTQIIVSPTITPVPATTDPVVALVGPHQPGGFAYNFEPGVTYYWRVSTFLPVASPPSATRSFTFTKLTPPFAISAPAVGATGITVMPILSWTRFTGDASSTFLPAKWYEVTLSEYPDFSIPEWSHNVGSATNPITVYGLTKDETLKYNTTYFWRVRGVYADPFVQGSAVITPASAWQIGAFTTMAAPAAAPPAQTVVVTQPAPPAPPAQIVTVPVPGPVQQQAIPDWMLLTIIIIGAVLVIALIVLIVRTRRVA